MNDNDLELVEGDAPGEMPEQDKQDQLQEMQRMLGGGGGQPPGAEQNIRVSLPAHPDASERHGPTLSVSITQQGRNVNVSASVDTHGRVINAAEYDAVCRLLGQLT